jgi:N-acetylneuraminate lyase
MPRFAPTQIKGIIPALVTPFDENEGFDETRMRSCVRFLLGRNVNGLYLTGSTGEAFLMSPEERKRAVEVVVDEVAGRIPVIAHVGAIGTRVSIDLAQHAESTGVDAISSVPPFYYSFSQDQILSYYRDLTGSTGLPMIAYNIPLAGVMGLDLIKRIADISGVTGIKYTAATHHEIMRLKAEVGQHFRIYSGSDEMALSGFSFGADGLIGSFYNLIPEVFMSLNEAMATERIEDARNLQRVANTIIFFSLARNMFMVIKRAMAWQGADAGYCRRPIGSYVDLAWEERLKAEFRKLATDNDLEAAAFLKVI